MVDSRDSDMVSIPEQERSSEVVVNDRNMPTIIWVVILIVYLLLFVATGYEAFFVREYNPAIDLKPEVYMNIKDEQTKALFINTLKEEAETYQKKRELASQSFNVVLGALLGFLSASAVSGFRYRGK